MLELENNDVFNWFKSTQEFNFDERVSRSENFWQFVESRAKLYEKTFGVEVGLEATQVKYPKLTEWDF